MEHTKILKFFLYSVLQVLKRQQNRTSLTQHNISRVNLFPKKNIFFQANEDPKVLQEEICWNEREKKKERKKNMEMPATCSEVTAIGFACKLYNKPWKHGFPYIYSQIFKNWKYWQIMIDYWHEHLPWTQAVGAGILRQESGENWQCQNIYQIQIKCIIYVLQ